MNKNVIFYLILLITLIAGGCDSLTKNERNYAVQYKPVFCLEDPFAISSKNKSGIQDNKLFFKVTPRYTYKNRITSDTVTIEYSKSKNIVEKEYEFYLTMEEIVTIDKLEELLTAINIQNHNLKEKLYWIKELANAHLVTVRNDFGDIKGYYVKSISGNTIPKEYYELKVMENIDTGGSGVGFDYKPIKLGRIEHQGNIIALNLELTFDFRNLKKSQYFDIDNSETINALYTNRLTLLSLNGKDANINIKGKVIGLEIWMNSQILFNKDRITTSPDFAPFEITFLN